MSSARQRSCVRFAIFVVVCGVVGCLWRYEVSLGELSSDLAFQAFIVLAPAFVFWLFGREIWEENLSRTTFVAPVCGLGVLAGAALFDGAIVQVRRAPGRMQIQHDLHEICPAMHSYQAKFGSLPPAALQSPEGKPLLSLRVLLLPFLD